MSDPPTFIRVLDFGPLHVRGRVDLFDTVGNRFETGEQFTLCRCGQSAQAPFCDGSHRTHRFDSCPRAAPPEEA